MLGGSPIGCVLLLHARKRAVSSHEPIVDPPNEFDTRPIGCDGPRDSASLRPHIQHAALKLFHSGPPTEAGDATLHGIMTRPSSAMGPVALYASPAENTRIWG